MSRTRNARPGLDLGRVSVPFAAVVGGLLALGFVLAVASRPETRGLGDLALVAVALGAGACLARVACGPGTPRVVGGLAALTAAWLLPQRTDAPSAAILAIFFGAGVGRALFSSPGT